MSTTETKLDAILGAIREEIAERERVAADAMRTIEKMNPTLEEYKDANHQFGANSYVANYLKHIMGTVKDNDYQSLKRLEQCIRFHHFQQHTKGALDDHRDISLGQATVAVILGGYIEQFFK